MSMTIEDTAVYRPARPVPDIPSNVMAQLSMVGKVVAVTGAADGIGHAVAEGMAEAGADVALLYHSNAAAVEKAAALAAQHHVRAKAYQVDVTDPAAIEATIAAAERDFGRLDVFIANSGTSISKGIFDLTVKDYRKIMAVNVDGVVFCAKYAGEVFRRQGSGNFIITSSMAAHIVGVPKDSPIYFMSKAAVSHLGRQLAREWREFARVNVVEPGWFETKMGAGPAQINEAHRMTVLGRQGNLKEIKGAYLYLASDASTYHTGSSILIDGGYTLP